eukprot:TRINITY_DN4769_c1_g1_i1.p1 TRINITY_DN4769_c1_g1~~TRINITY_DN4769_c1_g1_i1.p1  ORF type:complete len:283 (+),score=31.37 TRINITY_DN4769_c1_g1_i1:59-850(+)
MSSGLDNEIINVVKNKGVVRIKLVWEDGTSRERHVSRRNYFVNELEMTKAVQSDIGYVLWYDLNGKKVYLHWQFPAGVTVDFLTLVVGELTYPIVINVEKYTDVKYADKDKAKLPYFGGSPYSENNKQAIFIKKGNLNGLSQRTYNDRRREEESERNDETRRPDVQPVYMGVIPLAVHMISKSEACSSYSIKKLDLTTDPQLTLRQYISKTYSKLLPETTSLKGRVLVQGITPPDDTPMIYLYHLLQHTDELLHISVLWESVS